MRETETPTSSFAGMICRKKKFEEQTPLLMNDLYAKAKEAGGQVSGEHGIGHARAGYLEKFMGEDMIELYRGSSAPLTIAIFSIPGK